MAQKVFILMRETGISEKELLELPIERIDTYLFEVLKCYKKQD
jgi:hypothetical protein